MEKTIPIRKQIKEFKRCANHIRGVQDYLFSLCEKIASGEMIGVVQKLAEHWNWDMSGYWPSLIQNLLQRGIDHDYSKFSVQEWPAYAELNDGRLKKPGLAYGSDEYKKIIHDTLGDSLDHHYENNDHHPEHYKNGLEDMKLPAILEMLCDWNAVTSGNPSVEVNQQRFGYTNEQKELFEEFYQLLNS